MNIKFEEEGRKDRREGEGEDDDNTACHYCRRPFLLPLKPPCTLNVPSKLKEAEDLSCSYCIVSTSYVRDLERMKHVYR